MKETSKSVLRRIHDIRFATRYFVGHGVDIGAGADPLSLYAEVFPGITGVREWNEADGDAQMLAGLADESFDFAHASHCLEHLTDPAEALRNWFRILKPGGHLVILVPDEDLYEQGLFPGGFSAGTHRSTFTTHKARSWSARSVSLMELLPGLGETAQILKIELLDAGYRHALPHFDQTLTPVGECAIEVIVRKRPPAEVAAGGRLPMPGRLTAEEFHRLTGMPIPR